MTDFADIKMYSISHISITSVRVFLIIFEIVFGKKTQERVDAGTLDSFSISAH